MASIQTISLLVTNPTGTLVNVRALDCGLGGAQTGAQLLSVIETLYPFQLWGSATADGHDWSTIVFNSFTPGHTRLTAEAQLDAALAQWRTSAGPRFTVHVVPPPPSQQQTAGHGPAAAQDPGTDPAEGPWPTKPGSRPPPGAGTLAQMRGMLGGAQL
jgi:hypothetical protein